MQEDVYQGDGLNVYAYCKNNPVVYCDPSGYVAAPQQSGNGCGQSGKIGEGGRDVGNITEKLDTNNIPNMTKQDIIDNIPNDWNYTEHNGFVHIRDADGKVRIRIDPPDRITDYPHVHVYDRNGNYYRIIETSLSGRRTALDIDGNIVPNNVRTERGTMRGMKQSEYNAITHFNNTDLDFDK